jgi:hypothetical protein
MKRRGQIWHCDQASRRSSFQRCEEWFKFSFIFESGCVHLQSKLASGDGKRSKKGRATVWGGIRVEQNGSTGNSWRHRQNRKVAITCGNCPGKLEAISFTGEAGSAR